MSLGHYLIFSLGTFLEVTILWRSLRLQLWRYYPLFYVCIGFIFIRTVTLFVLSELRFPDYATVYWFSEVCVLVLFFLIPWEVLRHTFASMPSVRHIAGRVIVVLLIGWAWTIFYAGGNLAASQRTGSFYYDLERKVAFAQAAFLLIIVLLALYYRIPIGRNIRGMAIGFGLFVSVSIMNYAALELVESFFPLWRYISPLTFVGVLGIWTWALWSYAPNPKLAPDRIQGLKRLLVDWQNGWNQMRAAVRKAVGL